MEKTIGQGTYGKVKLATNLQTNERVSILAKAQGRSGKKGV
jgi:serine/threonine protein kinase